MSGTPSALFHRDPTYTYPVIVRGDGIYLYDEAGKRYIDGGAGATNVTLGHGSERIAAAMAQQAGQLAYVFSARLANQPAIEFANRIAAIAPGDLNHVYFVSGGSEANESALKLVRLYHQERGNGDKRLVISRWRSYHGATLGALSLTGIPSLRKNFDSWLLPFPHIEACYPYRCPLGCEGSCNLACADALEQAILESGPENVAAFIADPIGPAAVSVPPPDYYPRIREICDQYDVLFIVDEVITGFGRTGKFFAIEHWDTLPDMITFGKGASSGYCPLGGVILTDRIREVVTESGNSFPHIFTYVNNPVATRVGLEVLDIIEEENMIARVAEAGDQLFARAAQLKKHSIVGDVRGKGLLLGLELVKDQATKEPFPPSMEVNKRLNRIFIQKALSCATGGASTEWTSSDDLLLSPPFIITGPQIDELIQIIDEGLAELQEELSGL